MHELMGTQHDKDVRTHPTSVPSHVLKAWLDGEDGVGPSLEPMRVDWSDVKNSTWNWRLFEKFVLHAKTKVSDLKAPPPDRDELQEMFYSRLKTLRPILLGAQPQELEDGESETQDQIWHRLHEKDSALLKQARDKARRQTVSRAFLPSFLPELKICGVLIIFSADV